MSTDHTRHRSSTSPTSTAPMPLSLWDPASDLATGAIYEVRHIPQAPERHVVHCMPALFECPQHPRLRLYVCLQLRLVCSPPSLPFVANTRFQDPPTVSNLEPVKKRSSHIGVVGTLDTGNVIAQWSRFQGDYWPHNPSSTRRLSGHQEHGGHNTDKCGHSSLPPNQAIVSNLVKAHFHRNSETEFVETGGGRNVLAHQWTCVHM